VDTVDGVVAVAELQSHSGPHQAFPTSLADAARRVVDDLRPQFVEKGVDLRLDLATNGLVMADEPRIDTCIQNLLRNALRFTPRGGRVALSVAIQGDGVRLTVRDTGLGFDPTKAEGLFQPFIRIHDEHEDTQGGLGLGLFFVRYAIERSDGQVFAASAGPMAGSEFGFQLPAMGEPRRRPGRTGVGTSRH
jgi:signal transduction histidine kinase